MGAWEEVVAELAKSGITKESEPYLFNLAGSAWNAAIEAAADKVPDIGAPEAIKDAIRSLMIETNLFPPSDLN